VAVGAHKLDNYVGLIGSIAAGSPTTTQRFVRVDANGRLEIVFAAGVIGDVNLVQIAGNAVASAGVNGMLAVGGDVPDDAAASASYPLKMGGLYEASQTSRDDGDIVTIAVDDLGNTRIVGIAADDAASDATAPVKIGAVADQVPSSVSDDDQVHLITDLERFLRIVSKAYDSLTASDKVSVQNTIASDRDEAAQTIADVTDVAAATVNYPSDAGIEIGNRDLLAFLITIQDVTSVTFEVSNDGTIWADYTGSVIDDGSGANGNAPAFWTSAAGVTTDFAATLDRCRFRYLRLGVLFPNNTNGAEITLIAGAN
jgi:hypothetical protein